MHLTLCYSPDIIPLKKFLLIIGFIQYVPYVGVPSGWRLKWTSGGRGKGYDPLQASAVPEQEGDKRTVAGKLAGRQRIVLLNSPFGAEAQQQEPRFSFGSQLQAVGEEQVCPGTL